MDNLFTTLDSLNEEIISIRRHLHKHPELSFEEVETPKYIADFHEQLGHEVKTGVGGNGVLAYLKGNHEGPTVALRADFDALPIHEETDLEFQSVNDGVMHACGHDGHTAILLSVAEILTARRERLSGRVLFMFQPAEEIVAGAAAMLEDGILQGVEVDAAIGLHLSSDWDTGTVAVSAGETMAATDSFTVTVTGRGGHAGFPHQNIDTVVLAAQAVTGLQTLVAREVSPLDSAVISVTAINGGDSHNIIPETVELRGTMRTFGDALRERLRSRLVEYFSSMAAVSGGTAELEWVSSAPALFNDPEKTAEFREVVTAVAGDGNVVEMQPVMGSEDMALWLRAAPGVFFWVGARNRERGIDSPHHHPEFDLDEDSFPLAMELLTRGIERFLGA